MPDDPPRPLVPTAPAVVHYVPVPEKGRSAERTLLVLLLVGGAFIGGYSASEYGHWKAWSEARSRPVPAGDAVISIPPSLTVEIGEPTEVMANTRGERVVWQSLDRTGGLSVKVSGSPKTALVTGKRAGVYLVQAYSAVEGVPTTPALLTVTVQSEAKK